ncbi:MAG TPA: methyltransferase domain-containing protein [Streptosporangiaceae bacterium]
MARTSGPSRTSRPGGGAAGTRPDVPGRHRAGMAGAAGIGGRTDGQPASAGELFTRFAVDYAAQRAGQPLTLLQAGCTTAGDELDLARLRSGGRELTVIMIDEDNEVTRAAVDARAELAATTLGDLRQVPLTPRSCDIVQCSMLLDRISHSDLVLGRLVEALRPGGLLLLRVTDRDSAAGFLDRSLPNSVRTAIWRRLRPGEPGPHPAVQEPLASARGIQSFVTRHGLAVAHRQLGCLLDGDQGPAGLLSARKLVSALSRGRRSWTHDELRYVIRKPEDQFARLVSGSPG